MNYAECVNYIEDIPRFTKKTSLAHTRRLLDELGDPEQGLRIIHVAGTNGKGSVCAYLRAMLREAGYRVGSFTSPHLIRINERFCIDGEPISDGDFTDAFHTAMGAARTCMAEGEEHPTYFELLFLMGMVYFSRRKVDVLILETGLGGRLDATNAIRRPAFCVITSIGLDHTRYLGDTIRKIAGEKAGICKPGVPVFYEAADPEAAEVIRGRAEELGCPSFPLAADAVQTVRSTGDGFGFTLASGGRKFRLLIRQRADYQVRNAALAWTALWNMRGSFGLEEGLLAKGLRRMEWPGRMQELDPRLFVDGAHNAEGMRAFTNSAKKLCAGQKTGVLFSASADKPWPEMVRLLCRELSPETAVVTEAPGGRAAAGEEIAALFSECGIPRVLCLPETRRAFEAVLKEKDPVWFVVGSLYLAGAFLDWYGQREEEQ